MNLSLKQSAISIIEMLFGPINDALNMKVQPRCTSTADVGIPAFYEKSSLYLNPRPEPL